jgi:hypothetical protein
MKWNGRNYRPPMGRTIYPPRQESIAELLKPLSEKTRKGNVWIPVLNQPLNVKSPDTSPVPPTSPTPTPTKTSTPTPTPTSSETPTPTPTASATPPTSPSPTPSPSAQIIDYTFREARNDNTNNTTYTFSSVDLGVSGMVVVAVGTNTIGVGASITNVTIDGITAVQAVGGGFSNSHLNGIFYAEVTASTGTITVTTSVTSNSIVIGVWKVVGYSSTTPFYINSASSTSTTLGITTSSLPSRTMGVGVVTDSNTNYSYTWTNATERYEINNGDFTSRAETSGADFLGTTSGTRTVSVSGLGGTGARLDLAVWS